MRALNIPLVIGIVLPLLFVAIISVVLFGPSFFVHPAYSFIYSDDGSYGYYQDYRTTYAVVDGRLIAKPTSYSSSTYVRAEAPNLFLYDIKTDSTHQVSFDQVKSLVLDPGPSSPDGYVVAYDYNNAGIFELFGSNSNSGYFISNGKGKKKLNGFMGTQYWSQSNFKFLGWVK